jgi:hypothetical protein
MNATIHIIIRLKTHVYNQNKKKASFHFFSTKYPSERYNFEINNQFAVLKNQLQQKKNMKMKKKTESCICVLFFLSIFFSHHSFCLVLFRRFRNIYCFTNRVKQNQKQRATQKKYLLKRKLFVLLFF